MPIIVTVFIGKLASLASRLAGRGGGSALPGLWAERLDSQVIGKLSKGFRHGVILITGTNGKTTTTKLLAEIMDEGHVRIVTNRAGSNLSRGIASTLVQAANWGGRVKGDWGVFEVDEASLPVVAAQTNPKHIVVLNLFRDQLDRYGELDKTARLIGESIANSPRAAVYLNADDPLVASLSSYVGEGRSLSYFGVDDPGTTKLASDETADSDICPICGDALKYEAKYFGHIGRYSCHRGHFERPQLDTVLTKLVASDHYGSTFEVKSARGSVAVSVRLAGLYNRYNTLAAMMVAEAVGVDTAVMTCR